MEKWELETKQLQAELAQLKEENDAYVVDELLSQREGNLIVSVFDNKSLKDLQNLAGKLAVQSDCPVLLATIAENKVVLANNSTALSCGAFFKSEFACLSRKRRRK